MTAAMDPLRLEGHSIVCEPFTADAISERYLSWLNDPEVNRYSRRRYVTTTESDARAFLAGLRHDECVLAITERDSRQHIGNIQFGPIEWSSRRAEIRILVGDRSVWGKGYGTEAVYLVTRYLFASKQLHRVEAGSCNPAFIRLVQKLGWRIEGRLRDYVRFDAGFADWTLLAQLESEFVAHPEFERVG